MIKFVRRYLPAVLSLVILTGLAAVSFADQQAAKNAKNEGLPEQAAERAKEKAEKTEEVEAGEGEAKSNHGHCVSYAAHLAKDEFEGRAKGAFISAVAQDKDAETMKVAEGGTADASCQAAIDAARTSATAVAAEASKNKAEENRSDSDERGKSAGKGKAGS